MASGHEPSRDGSLRLAHEAPTLQILLLPRPDQQPEAPTREHKRQARADRHDRLVSRQQTPSLTPLLPLLGVHVHIPGLERQNEQKIQPNQQGNPGQVRRGLFRVSPLRPRVRQIQNAQQTELFQPRRRDSALERVPEHGQHRLDTQIARNVPQIVRENLRVLAELQIPRPGGVRESRALQRLHGRVFQGPVRTV